MTIFRKKGRIYTYWYTNAPLKQQVTYLEIGLLDETGDQELYLKLLTFFLLGQKGRKFCDSVVLSVLPSLTP